MISRQNSTPNHLNVNGLSGPGLVGNFTSNNLQNRIGGNPLQMQQQQNQSLLYGRNPMTSPTLFSQWSAMQSQLGLLSSMTSPGMTTTTTSSPTLVVAPRPTFSSTSSNFQRFSPFVVSAASPPSSRPLIRSTPSPAPSSISPGSERTSPRTSPLCDDLSPR